MKLLFLFSLFLTFDATLCLTQSDGYNIGVILGSIIAALVAIAIAAFIFYMCCVKNWLSPNEPKDIGYKRQNDFGAKKPKPRPSTGSGRGSYNVRGASVVPKSDNGRRDRYKTDYDSEDYERGRKPQTFPDDRTGMVSIVGSKGGQPTASLRYSDSTDVGGGRAQPAVVLSSSEGMERGRNSSNLSYSSESELRGRPNYEAQRIYQQETTYTRAVASTSATRVSPTALSAAYLGTGV